MLYACAKKGPGSLFAGALYTDNEVVWDSKPLRVEYILA